MNRNTPVVVFLSLIAFVPVFLAVNQSVPTQFSTQQAVLLLSLAALGLVLGQFWLSRLTPRSVAKVKPAVMFRWHKAVGYAAGAFLLIHPVLVIVRRFWVLESDPVDNLFLMLRAPALLPAIIAWVLLALLVVLALVRRGFSAKSWRIMHGLVSSGFSAMAVWHVVTVGRHSNAPMSSYWIILVAGAVGALFLAYRQSFLKTRSTSPSDIKGGAHEPA